MLKQPDGAKRAIRAAWVAGCDGYRSAAREMSGITFQGWRRCWLDPEPGHVERRQEHEGQQCGDHEAAPILSRCSERGQALTAFRNK